MTITTFVIYNDDYVGHIATVSSEPVNANALVVLRATLSACNPLEVNPWFLGPVLDCLGVDCGVVRIVVAHDLGDGIDIECCQHKSHKLHQTPSHPEATKLGHSTAQVLVCIVVCPFVAIIVRLRRLVYGCVVHLVVVVHSTISINNIFIQVLNKA